MRFALLGVDPDAFDLARAAVRGEHTLVSAHDLLSATGVAEFTRIQDHGVSGGGLRVGANGPTSGESGHSADELIGGELPGVRRTEHWEGLLAGKDIDAVIVA